MSDSPVAKASTYHLLVVDDDQEQASMISDYLVLSGSFEVELAFDAQSLWEREAARPYDAMLLENNLGDGNGADIFNELPCRGCQIPVVMVTGQGDERVAAQAKLMQAARLAAIGDVASEVAHQISNPFTTVIADAQILLNTQPDVHPGCESAKAIEQAGWQPQQVVRRLMEFARLDADTLETLPLNQTIENALILVGAAIRSAGVSLEFSLSQPSPAIFGNARQLENLWVKELLLARDATADGEKHTISIHTRSGKAEMVTVGIHDDGKTILPHQVETFFETDFVGLVSGRGIGMELSICQEIVRQHQSHIEAHSESGKGTTFRVQFPVEHIPLRG
ncbi:MAG: ATP-binding protein [Anaerolineales bacterium]|nr:ATP-binding protein [Anaerolineales bacterium]